MDDYEEVLHVLVVGSQGVGKSCILNRLANSTYSQSYVPTVIFNQTQMYGCSHLVGCQSADLLQG